jgi:ketosteroid isomerase-like protein
VTDADVLKTHVDVFYGALKNRDFDTLAEVYSDDYMLVRPDGSVLNKQEVLRDLRDQGLTFQSIELEQKKVRIYGIAAVLTGESKTVTARDGKEVRAHFRLVAVYAQKGDRLELVHFQSTSLPE